MTKITKKNRISALLILLISALIISALVFLITPNSGEILVPGNVALTVDGMKLSVGFYNYFYSAATSPEMLVNMEEMYEDFDSSIPLQQQVFDKDSGKTWAEYINETVEEQISYLIKAYNIGKQHDICLFEEQSERVNLVIDSLYKEADKLSIGINSYTEFTYGKYVGEKTVRRILEMSYVAQNAYEFYSSNYEITQDEYLDFKNKNKDELVYAEFVCCKLNVEDNRMQELRKDFAVFSQSKIMTDNCESEIEKLFSKYDKNISVHKTVRTNYDGNEEVEKWVFDLSRKSGDKVLIENDNSRETYIIFMISDAFVNETETCSVRELAMRFDDFESREAVKTTACFVQEQIKASDNKDYTMAVYSDIYMNSGKSDTANGGLIVDLKAADGIAERWIYAAERKSGDVRCFESEVGYYIVMFVDKKPSWQFVAEDRIINSSFEKITNDAVFKKKYAFKYTEGGMADER